MSYRAAPPLAVLAHCLVACMSRVELGAEDGGPCATCAPDAGGDDGDSGVSDDPRKAFVRDLCERPWRGTARIMGGPPVALELSFLLDGSYIARCLDTSGPDCLPFVVGAVESGMPGRFWITDHTLNGEFWGRTRDAFAGQANLEGLLDHMSIRGDELTFVRRQRVSVLELDPVLVVLERER